MAGASEVEDALTRREAVVGPSDRGFGITFAVIFTILALLPLLGGGTPAWWPLVVAAVFAALAMLRPALLAPLNRLWLRIGLLLHAVVNPLILALTFLCIITPMGLAMRLLGKRTIALRPDPAAPSYWVLRVPPGPDPQTMRRSF